MPDNFQQTVNLKEKMEEKNNPPVFSSEKKPATIMRKVKRKKAEDIDEVYREEGDLETKRELQNIKKAPPRKDNTDLYKFFTIVLLILLVIVFGYFNFFKEKETVNEVKVENQKSGWYAIKLATGEVYYGQVVDTTSDPVKIDNVYYDYDQLNKDEKEKTETSNLRLVKRGKETHGPDGSMNIIRTHILYMEPLSADSKVLKAILNYEK